MNEIKSFLVYDESSGKSSHDKSMRLVSCGYEFILCDYIMLMPWTRYTDGYINKMKSVWSTRYCSKHGWWRDTRIKVAW